MTFMKALVYHGRRDVRYEDFPMAGTIPAGEVRLRVKAAALCHTDFNEYASGPIFMAAQPHPRSGRSLPIVLGHEFAGEVVETGPGATRIRAGDRVAVNAVDGCRQCELCRRGRYALCPSAAYLGFARDGGFAEYALAPEACCHRLPPNVPDAAGALVEPFSVALHAVAQAGFRIGGRAAVVGGGAVGLCVLQALQTSGARDVVLLEKSEIKHPFAERLGATVLNPDRVNAPQVIRELTSGLGPDFVFECVGSAQALRMATDIVSPGGTVCVVGLFAGPFEFDWNTPMKKELSMIASLAYGEEFPTVIAMLADGRLKAEPLITRRLPLDSALEDGLKPYETHAVRNIRMVIDMTPDSR